MASVERRRYQASCFGFCVRRGCESEDSRTFEEHVICNRPQEDGRSVRDQTSEEPVTFFTLFWRTGWKVGVQVSTSYMRNEEPRTSLLGHGTSQFLFRKIEVVKPFNLRSFVY